MELLAVMVLCGLMNMANAIADASPHTSGINRTYYNVMTLATWVTLFITALTSGS